MPALDLEYSLLRYIKSYLDYAKIARKQLGIKKQVSSKFNLQRLASSSSQTSLFGDSGTKSSKRLLLSEMDEKTDVQDRRHHELRVKKATAKAVKKLVSEGAKRAAVIKSTKQFKSKLRSKNNLLHAPKSLKSNNSDTDDEWF